MANQSETQRPVVVLVTSMGDITLELNDTKAPLTAENFLEYVEEGFYDGTVFHRVIPGFMVQGGGLDQELEEKSTGAPIKNEADNGLKNLRGTVAMARTQEPDSATSQFFINLVDNPFLDPSPGNPGYAVFAEVIEGMETVDRIANLPTGRVKFHDDVPTTTVIIQAARRRD